MAQSNNRAQQAFENMRLAAKYGIQRPSSTMLQGGVNYDAQPSTSGNAQSNQAFNIYQQLMQGGGRPTAPMVQPQQEHPFITALRSLLQQPEAGDGFNFNRQLQPAPDASHLNLMRILGTFGY